MPHKKLLLIVIVIASVLLITAPVMAQDIEYTAPSTGVQTDDDEIVCCSCLTCQIDLLPPARPTPAVQPLSCVTAVVEGVDKRICCYAVTATYQIKNRCQGYCWANDYYYGSATYTAEHTPCAGRCVLFNQQRVFPLILKW